MPLTASPGWGQLARMSVFHGEFEHGLDEKGRIIIPLRCREPIQDELFLTRGLERCLWLFPWDTWEFISAKLGSLQLPYREARLLERALYAGTSGHLDRQGRLLLPPSLREFAELQPGEPVIIVGVKNRLELWNPHRWREETEKLLDGSIDLDGRLRELGI